MQLTFRSAIATFGADAKAKLDNPGITGAPEDQLRTPLESLVGNLVELCGLPRSKFTVVGEASLADLKTRPDLAVVLNDLLVGFIEVKAPGKGADPRKFKDQHDKEQWEKLQSLPNLIYTDGNEFSLWRSGELAGTIVRLNGDIQTSGRKLGAPVTLQSTFDSFFKWEPTPPRNVKQLAEMSARLCRLVREEVAEQLSIGSEALTALAKDWRKMLFPEATNKQFADGYAQAVTFGLLVARARGIQLSRGLDHVARQLGKSSSLIGAALRILTDDVENQTTLKTSLGTLTRVLDVVHWEQISKGDPEAWLYFYEDFLTVYDNQLRILTGSYYTPPEVVGTMVRLVDEVLASRTRFNLSTGLAAPEVTVADPAVGTGTFLLGLMRRIAETIKQDQGGGAVGAAINDAVKRLIAFEIQLGPFAVAQLRILAEVAELTGDAPTTPLRMFVTDTLADPYVEEEWLPSIFKPIAESRRHANKIKKKEPITVVIGNPPYKEKAKGRGGWVEEGHGESHGILNAWIPPSEWGVSAHSKHLRNLYVYFWRWATWKVFDDRKANTGIVCFISVAGFLNGPGFQRMRDYLRRTTDEIWVIDCSPEGHQPEVNTRIFQGVQQPVCIVLASRSPNTDSDLPATVRFRSLREGRREKKFEELSALSVESEGWTDCPSDWRAAFLPQATGAWSTYPAIDDFFVYNGCGVMPGRTWIIAPDAESLKKRWETLVNARARDKEDLFHPHLRKGKPGDKHSHKKVTKGLPGHERRVSSVAQDADPCVAPTRYAFRSFDRQWIIPDNRLINQPNADNLWGSFSDEQVFLTVFTRHSPTSGPAITFAGLIPDLDHYKGSFGGRAFPMWYDQHATQPNVRPALLDHISKRYGTQIGPEDLMTYIAAVAAHPAFTSRFEQDLVQPGLRIPLSADVDLFSEAAELGREVIWLHTFGERFADAKAHRPRKPPRLPRDRAPRIPSKGAIPSDSGSMPDDIQYDDSRQRLLVGDGYIERVPPEVWRYEVSGKQVLRQWFSYRKANRERPIIGDRRPPSRLNKIQPDRWLAEYTTELINVLHVLGRLVELEPRQADLLKRVCSAPTLSVDELTAANALTLPKYKRRTSSRSRGQGKLFD